MRCLACDTELSDFEATRKYYESKHYVELCNTCFSSIKSQVRVIERHDLLKNKENVDD